MNNQKTTQNVTIQVQENYRVVYVKPTLETHPEYKSIVALGGSIPNFIGQPISIISDPGLELIPDPVDIEF
jgi:hypothetical protein